MTWTAYPFDNQDTTESQYSLLFRELQDSGVIGSYGDTTLQVTANSSAMAVFIQIGSALLRGFKVDNDAVYTVAINAAGATIRYDAIILRLDPSLDSIVPVYVPNAGAVPTLTTTETGIYELLLAIVTVNPGSVTVASTAVADMRQFVRRRISVAKSTNRPSSPRAYDKNIAPDKGGRTEIYDPTAGWVTRDTVFWGSGAAFPTIGIQTGDSFIHTTYGLCLYNGTAWKRVSGEITLGSTAYTGLGTTLSATQGGADQLSITATSSGGAVNVEWMIDLRNGASGADRVANVYVYCDTTVIGSVTGISIPYNGGVQPGIPKTGVISHAPTAGSHTWHLRADSNGVGATVVSLASTLRVVER